MAVSACLGVLWGLGGIALAAQARQLAEKLRTLEERLEQAGVWGADKTATD